MDVSLKYAVVERERRYLVSVVPSGQRSPACRRESCANAVISSIATGGSSPSTSTRTARSSPRSTTDDRRGLDRCRPGWARRLGPPPPLTNPWLSGEKPTARLPPDELEERILNLLSRQNTAVVATVSADGSPLATPVRFSSLGLEVFYTSWSASVKSRNLRRDPRVSVGIVAPLVGPASSPTTRSRSSWRDESSTRSTGFGGRGTHRARWRAPSRD